MLVEHRLHFSRVAEQPGRPMPWLNLVHLPRRTGRLILSPACRAAIFVATHAADRFAGADNRPAPHRLDHHASLVKELEVDEGVGGDGKAGGAAVVDGHGAEDPLVVEVVPSHARRLLARAAVPGRSGPEAFFGRLDDAEILDAARRDLFHSRAQVDVFDPKDAFVFRQVDPRGNRARLEPRAERHRIVAARLLRVQEDLVAMHVDQVEAHLLAPPRHARTEKMRFRQRIRVLVLRLDPCERVVVALAHQVDRAGGPGLKDRLAAVHAPAAIDDRKRAPGAVVARRKGGDEPLRAGNRPGVEHRAGRVRVVAPVDGVVGPVGIGDPNALGVAKIAVHVFPAVVDHAPVGQQGRMALVQRAVADLLDVRAVGVHREQVAHDVPIAHAVLRLAGRGEENPAVSQIDRVDVRQPGAEGQLLEVRPVRIHLVKMVIVLAVAAHRKQDPLAVKADIGIAGDALGNLEQRLQLAASQVDRLDRGAAHKARRVDFAGLEHGGGVMMVRPVLRSDDEEDRLSTDRRGGHEDLAAERFQRGAFRLVETLQVGQRLGRSVAGGRRQVLDRAAQGEDGLFTEALPPDFRSSPCGFGIDPCLGGEIVEGNVSPAALLAIDEAQQDAAADPRRGVPGHALHGLAILAARPQDLLAVFEAQGHVRGGVGTAADQQRSGPPGKDEHRRLDDAGEAVVRAIVVSPFERAQVELALFGVRDLVVKFGLSIADKLVEIAFDHVPTLQVARFKVESNPRVLPGRCRLCSNSQQGPYNERLPA